MKSKIMILILSSLLLISGCGSANDILGKMKIWNEKSEKIEIVQYSGQIQSNEHRVELYTNNKDNFSKATLDKLNKTYAFDNLQGMSCDTDAITYRIIVFGRNNSLSQFYSANTYCNNTKGKKFIPVVNIEQLIEILGN